MNHLILLGINFVLLVIFSKSKIPRIFFLMILTYLSYKYVDLADYTGYLQMYEGLNGNSSGMYFL